MITDISDCQKILPGYLESYGYETDNLTLLGSGSEGAVFSTKSHIFKFFFEGMKTFSGENLAFITRKFLNNAKISGVRQLSDIINDGEVVIFVTPYEAYSAYEGGDAESIIEILVDSKQNNYIYTNFHPKNLMYDSNHKLRIIDIGRSLACYNQNGYNNMVRRAFLTTYFYQRSDLSELMSSIHQSGYIEELNDIDNFLEIVSEKTQSTRDAS